LGFGEAGGHIAASIGSIETIVSDRARERLSASTLFPEAGSPDKTIRVGGSVAMSAMTAFDNFRA
jgi:hypothetical protein